MKWSAFCLIVLVSFAPTKSMAQENGPIVIPENLQRIAADPKFGLAERLGISWEKANPDDTGRYLGLLAGVSEIATTIAAQNGKKEAGEVEFLAALSIACLWPPNKPPLVQNYWGKIIPAYWDKDVRMQLDKAVGPGAIEISNAISKGESLDAIFAKYQDEASYSANFLDLGRLGLMQ